MSAKTQYLRDSFIAAARDGLGYRANPFKDSVYGTATGYGAQHWDGSFLEVARLKAGISGPALTSTTAALAWFTRKNRLYPRPRVGDVAFFAYSTDGDFAQPHIGLVTAVEKHQLFRVIEAQVSLRSLPEEVAERLHHTDETIGFGRLDYREVISPTNPNKPTSHIRISDVLAGHSRSVILVQEALGIAVGMQDAQRGRWDTVTASALWRFQRERGIVHLHGKPDRVSLERLGTETGWFQVDG